jgi:hypothetical protein
MMSLQRWLPGCLLIGVAAALCTPSTAVAQTASGESVHQDSTQTAREWMKAGTAAYESGDLEGARRAFEQAWRAKRHFAVAFNLAEVELKLGRFAEAADHLKYGLANLPAGRDSDRATAVQQLAQSRQHLGHVLLTAIVDGAAVTVDGVESGTTPLADGLDLTPGTHSLLASRSGYRSAQASVTLGAGESREVSLELTPLPAPNDSAQAPNNSAQTRNAGGTATATSAKHSSARLMVGVSGGILTAAAVAIGVVYSIKQSDAEQRAKSADANIAAWVASHNMSSPQNPIASDAGCTAAGHDVTACNALAAANSDVNSDKKLRTVGFVSAGVFGAATVIAVLAWPSSSERSANLHLPLAVTPWAEPHARGLMLTGTF